jgi:hypothetical protein
VSRAFIEASTAKLKEFQHRGLAGERYVALFLDGKSFADATLVIALGVTSDGTKRFLGFVETDTENEKVLTPFLRSLVERGLDLSQGLLVVIDGGKGLRSAVRQVFKRSAVQRCMWHIAGRSPRLQRGGTSPLGQIPMSPIAWGQAWRGNSSRRSRPDMLASEPSPEAPAKPRAAPQGNAFGAVNASRTSIAGRVREWGGRASCVMAKTATTVDGWGDETVVAPGV